MLGTTLAVRTGRGVVSGTGPRYGCRRAADHVAGPPSPDAFGGLPETIVEGHDLERRRLILGDREGRSELEGVRPTQAVHAEQTDGRLADPNDRLDFLPRLRESVETLEGVDHGRSVKAPLAFQASECGDARHLGRPPDDEIGIALIFGHHRDARRLGDEQRDDRGTVPESHRPERRSSMTAWTALVPAGSLGAGLRSRSSGDAARPIRMIPARSRRRRRPVGSGVVVTGSSQATASPRSVMRMLSPALTWSMSALSPFLTSVIVAVFILLFYPSPTQS